MGGIFARAPTCYFYDYEEGAWRWRCRGQTWRWAYAHCSCSCMEAYETWWLETEEGGLVTRCSLIWDHHGPPSWEEWEDERWYARRAWEKWQRQQVNGRAHELQAPCRGPAACAGRRVLACRATPLLSTLALLPHCVLEARARKECCARQNARLGHSRDPQPCRQTQARYEARMAACLLHSALRALCPPAQRSCGTRFWMPRPAGRVLICHARTTHPHPRPS